MRTIFMCLSVVACVAAWSAGGRGQQRHQDTGTSGRASSSSPDELGARLFKTYCASCHGVTATGNGPVAEELRRPLPDLTKYTTRNDGVFPSERLRRIIDGRGIRSHGNREMPVWGDAFRSSPEGLSPEQVRKRIDDIVRYLEAIQERAA